MKMKNIDIRNEVASANLRLWQVAEQLGITDGNFSRKLRKELSEDEKQRIRAIISNLSKGE